MISYRRPQIILFEERAVAKNFHTLQDAVGGVPPAVYIARRLLADVGS